MPELHLFIFESRKSETVTDQAFRNTMELDRRNIEAELHRYIRTKRTDHDMSTIIDAVEYTMFSGGKRLRPILAMEFCRACGKDPLLALKAGCAVEFVQAASIVQDDLPIIDDSPLRRGHPSLHVQYGDSTALLASDAMFAMAFDILMTDNLNNLEFRKFMEATIDAIDVNGLIGGEYLDIENETKALNVDQVKKIYLTKTEPLFVMAARFGCYKGKANAKKLEAAETYANNIGLCFQVIDDILDVTQSEEVMQKTVGKDAGKSTYPSLLGLDGARKQAEELTEAAIAALAPFGTRGEFLEMFARWLCERIY